MNVSDSVTLPAKPFVPAGLPKLVEEILTEAEPPDVKLTLVELLVRVNPLTLMDRVPDA